MVDLVFMEKIARWLTNTQVKIKSEVADSNSQAQKLGQHLNDLERRIDACEHPNLDKEVYMYDITKMYSKRLFFTATAITKTLFLIYRKYHPNS